MCFVDLIIPLTLAMSFVGKLLLTNIFLVGLYWLASRYGNANGRRWIDKLHTLLFCILPRTGVLFLELIAGKRGVLQVRSCYNYVVKGRNPLTMMLYIVVAVGGYIGFVVSAYPHLPNQTVTFPYHKECGFIIFCVSIFCFNSAVVTNPGIVTKSNHAMHYSLFPFDNVIFKQGVVCSTCRFAKPARSKHCRYCNCEIARFDHHCIWINQCVGLGNIKAFLLFLLSNNIMCVYGGYLGIATLLDMVYSQGLDKAFFHNTQTGERFQATPYYIFVYLIGTQSILCYVTIIALFMGVVLSFFTWYHWVTLIKSGLTTNEESKLGEVVHQARVRFMELHSKGSWWKNLKHLWSLSCPSVDTTKH